MKTTEAEQALCPFCQVLLPEEPELWSRVQAGVQIAGIPACDDCLTFAGYRQEQMPVIVAQVRGQRQLATWKQRRSRMTTMDALVGICCILSIILYILALVYFDASDADLVGWFTCGVLACGIGHFGWKALIGFLKEE